MSQLLTCEVIPASRLKEEQIQGMFTLFCRYYAEISWQIFKKDLLCKDLILLFRDNSGAVQGFTSLKIIDHTSHLQKIAIVYSGDTIIHKPYRNSQLFARTWIKTVWDIVKTKDTPCYWLLLTSGYRTYRFLPVFLKNFFPCYRQETPAHIQKLISEIAIKLFGSQYNQATGIVTFENGATPLKEGHIVTGMQQYADPHLFFYQQQNPDHPKGDELVCWAELSDENLTAIGKRMRS